MPAKKPGTALQLILTLEPGRPSKLLNLPNLSDVECVSLADGYLLHARKSGAIISSNEIGANIFSGLKDGRSARVLAANIAVELGASAEDAEAIIDQIVDLWRAAGLFAAQSQPFREPLVYRSLQSPQICVYQLGARRVVVRSEDPALADQLDCSLQAYAAYTATSPSGAQDLLLDVLVEGDDYGLFREGDAVWGRAAIDLTRFHIIRACMEHLCGSSRISALLHAGAVEKNGHALIIAGGSGAGKTTTTLGLCIAGCQFAADDHVALHRDSRRMIAFPTASALKRGTWKLPEVQAMMGDNTDQPMSPRHGVKYIQHHNPIEAGLALSVAAIVFPHFDLSTQNQMSRLEPSEALKTLIQTGGRLSRPNATIEPLADLLSQVPCYHLSYNNLSYSVQSCLNLL